MLSWGPRGDINRNSKKKMAIQIKDKRKFSHYIIKVGNDFELAPKRLLCYYQIFYAFKH